MPPSTPRGTYRGRGRARGGNDSPPRGRGRGRGHGGVIIRAPPGICNFYWASGACRHGFDCRFSHQEQQGTPPAGSDVSDDVTHDFFSPEGLAQNNGSIRSGAQDMKPQEVHNSLKALSVNQEFRSALGAESFAHLFGSVHPRNRHWDIDSAQVFLDFVVQSADSNNSFYLIGELLRWPSVGIDIPRTRRSDTLSFQRGYFPLLEFFASSLIIKSTIHQNVNKLYTLIENNFSYVYDTLFDNLAALIEARTWKDQSALSYLPVDRQDNLSGILVFQVVYTFLFQYFKLFKAAIRNHPEILHLVESIANWFDDWADTVTSPGNNFADDIVQSPPRVRQLSIEKLRKDVYQLRSIVRREAGVADEQRRPAQPAGPLASDMHDALITRLELAYVPPGDLRQGGPRHDNDFVDIADIRIAPTHEELMSVLPPYLPVFVPGGPHHLPSGSMQKHLDIQFRLLREELISTIRQSISAINADLSVRRERRTVLDTLLTSRGGAYRNSGVDSVFFHLYTNARFTPAKAERRNFTIGLSLDSPPGNSRHAEARQRHDFWLHSKRLSNGGLVALLLVSRDETRIFLGTVACSNEDIADSSKTKADRIEIRVSFFDPEVELYALQDKDISPKDDRSKFALLIDNNIMHESIRPFLETLKTIEPTSIPFAEYIASEGDLGGVVVQPPLYARAPGFRFDLSSLLPEGVPELRLDVQDPGSVEEARRRLERGSSLDPSQASTIVDALTRQICLVQGPPGTGKSYTGKELLRVLFANKVKPIVLIAFTNHALDHMLLSVLESRITTKIVRLGSRSGNERIAQYNLSKLENESKDGTSPLDVSQRRQYRRMKEIEEEMQGVMTSIQIPIMHWTVMQAYLRVHYPEVEDEFLNPPDWVSILREQMLEEEQQNGEWIEVTHKRKNRGEHGVPKMIYGFWKGCYDINFLGSTPVADEEGNVRDPLAAFFGPGQAPVPPPPTRSLSKETLLGMTNPWSMNEGERRRVAKIWEDEVRRQAYAAKVQEFEMLRQRYQEACNNLNDIRDQARQKLLSSVDLIGCTTTGAAQLVSLLTNVAPKVLIVEEAGQVLESHILASLVPSVQHLICIGDPEQLRPTLANYGLSMDSERGRRLFKFDRSLLERLSSNGCAMSLINMQRRMRPTISQYPRQILYPALQDHELVHGYPHVQGMLHDVFFISHTNAENEEKDSVSKYNMFEVKLIKDLVMYLLKQGKYSGQGDIAVLCAYLGQLQQVRKVFRDAKLAVSVNERDEEALELQDEENATPQFETVDIAKHIRLGTVDTFQGEEAKIVIVSLVRNSGDFAGDAAIGFLKSSNRINVALSRAQHGMYILGNASNLRKNPTWAKILTSMEDDGLVGNEIPIVCPRHRETIHLISQPGQIPTAAPEGGCLARCEFQLSCGHTCQSVCHPDLDQHGRMKCQEPCQRISCPRKHPCSRRCGDDCGDCMFPIYNVALPCGHIKDKVFCYEYDDLATVRCAVYVDRRLYFCEHTAREQCHVNPSTISCTVVCGRQMTCCSRTCSSPCHRCTTLSGALHGSMRTVHPSHPCKRLLYCQHECGRNCAKDHECNDNCLLACRQACSHHKCDKPCSQPCPPCMEPCAWTCTHGHICPVPCGSICARLPCDEPCLKRLECGHICPSVCGEPCENQQCPECLPNENKTMIVDFVLQRTLSELDYTSLEVSERIITLSCDHSFTVETLDGHCHMSDYYNIDELTGRYLCMKAPPVDFQIPPSCPTCRGPITARRYGRVTNRANLDILERNVASTMTKGLNQASISLEALKDQMEEMEKIARNMAVSPETPDLDAAVAQRSGAIKKKTLLPLMFLVNSPYTGFVATEATEWRTTIGPLCRVYKGLLSIAEKRGPHTRAYDAALATLYHLELAAVEEDVPEPEKMAMLVVNTKMGQPPHRADMRYQVEAFFKSLDVRLRIAQVARARLEGIATSRKPARDLWRSYIEFVYQTCVDDAHTALDIAVLSAASRQVARCQAYILRSEMFSFIFRILCEIEDHARAGTLDGETRQAIVGKIEQDGRRLLNKLAKTQDDYLRARKYRTLEERRAERTWFKENCREIAEVYVQEYEGLKEHVMSNKGYTPLSVDEMKEIVQAFNFAYRGHFYNCENGHPFVITECGGATQVSRCPECSAPIGGANHTLVGSNTRAMEFENISREHGGNDPHWAWGQGA